MYSSWNVIGINMLLLLSAFQWSEPSWICSFRWWRIPFSSVDSVYASRSRTGWMLCLNCVLNWSLSMLLYRSLVKFWCVSVSGCLIFLWGPLVFPARLSSFCAFQRGPFIEIYFCAVVLEDIFCSAIEDEEDLTIVRFEFSQLHFWRLFRWKDNFLVLRRLVFEWEAAVLPFVFVSPCRRSIISICCWNAEEAV